MQESRRHGMPMQAGGTRYVFAGTQGAREDAQTKVCPRCGEVLFADMDTCYGCLYDFSREEGALAAAAPASDGAAQPIARGPLPRVGRQARLSDDPLADIEIDEIDDADETRVDVPRAEPMSLPRHSKLHVASADSTIDLAAAGAGRDNERSPGCLAIVARSSEMQVRLPLPAAGMTIGRDASNDVVLSSRSVSRTHLRLAPLSGKVLVEDCGATNPAIVDGKPLEGTVSIGPGGLVVVCGTEFEVEGTPPDPAA